jgi:hypothetical protein
MADEVLSDSVLWSWISGPNPHAVRIEDTVAVATWSNLRLTRSCTPIHSARRWLLTAASKPNAAANRPMKVAERFMSKSRVGDGTKHATANVVTDPMESRIAAFRKNFGCLIITFWK